MAQNITKRRGKSSIKTRLKQERKAARLDPEGKKAFTEGLGTTAELLAYGVPIGVVGNLSAKAATKLLTKYKKYQKFQNTPSISLYRGEPVMKKSFGRTKQLLKQNPQTGKWYTTNKSYARDYAGGSVLDNKGQPKAFRILKEVKVSPKEFKKLQKGMADKKQPFAGSQVKNLKKYLKFKPNRTVAPTSKVMDQLAAHGMKQGKDFYGTIPGEIRRRAKVIPKAKGGVVKKRATSKRVKVTRGDGIAKRGKTRGRMV